MTLQKIIYIILVRKLIRLKGEWVSAMKNKEQKFRRGVSGSRVMK